MPKETKVKQSKMNLIMLAAALAVIVPTGGYVTYKYVTPTAVQSPYFNKTTTLAGDGTHQASIELTLLNGLNEPMSNVNITPQASIGNVSSCTTTVGGTCFINYTPPRTAINENATIFISIGNFHQNMQIAITPDQVTQVELSSNASKIYTNSSAKVTAILKDAFGNLIPNGAQINFSLQGGGSLSAISCLTKNGQCSINYTSPSSAGTATIYADSSSVNQQTNINVVSHQFQISLSSNTTQVYTNGTAKLNVTVRDAFGNLVANGTQINFSVQNGGQLSPTSCLTVKGQCGVNYIAPSTIGSTTIIAEGGNSSTYIGIGIESRFKAIQKQIFSIGNSAPYCSGSWPYYAMNLSLYSGENITWNIGNVSLESVSFGYGSVYPYRAYVFNGTQYSSFLDLVSNVTTQYQNYSTTCWNSKYYNGFNYTTYCEAGLNIYGNWNPSEVDIYSGVPNKINSNYLFGENVNTVSFIAQNSNIYHLVIFMPDYAYSNANNKAICFSSTVYNTIIENLS